MMYSIVFVNMIYYVKIIYVYIHKFLLMYENLASL